MFTQMITHEVPGQFEPEQGDLVQDLPFVRDPVGQDVIEGGDSIGGYDEQRIPDIVVVPHLSPTEERDAEEPSFDDRRHGWRILG